MIKHHNQRFRSALIAGGLLLAACGSGEAEISTSPVAESEQAAGSINELVIPTVDGGQFEFGSLEGQDTVLWFWAPW